jgi:chorismate lyase/3-hydroxybenzoate synthase
MEMSRGIASGPRVEFFRADAGWIPGDDALAALVYGDAPSAHSDPRLLHVGLSAGESDRATELWRAPGPTSAGIAGPIRFAAHPDFLFGILELDERRFGGLPGAAESAYRFIREFQERQPQRHLLRIWNFLDSINEGEGDVERYRRFCVGRSRGLGDFPAARLPAATAVGRRNDTGQIQVCWLAGRRPGLPVENPRQVRAYEYPRAYGPSPPSFARAMRLESGELMGSGTSSIVGHESLHGGDLAAQIDETLRNLRELHQAGGAVGAAATVKVYLRKGAGDPGIAEKVQAGLSGAKSLLLIEADICRRELLVEIECTWV